MSNKDFDLEREEKRLVLHRFKTMNPQSKLMVGEDNLTVKELIEHIEKEDEFGKASLFKF